MPGTVWQKQGILREIKEDIALKKPIVEQGQEVCNRNLHKAQGKCTRMRGACGTLETQREHIWSGAWKQPSYGGGGTADGGLGVMKDQRFLLAILLRNENQYLGLFKGECLNKNKYIYA